MDPTAENAASWLSLFERYGVSIVMLGVFVFAAGYVIHRLMSSKNGILTNYMTKVGESHERLADSQEKLVSSYERLEQTDAGMADLMKAQVAQLDGIEVKVKDHGDRTECNEETLLNILDYHSNIIEVCIDRLDEIADVAPQFAGIKDDVAPHLKAIREETEKHRNRHST